MLKKLLGFVSKESVRSATPESSTPVDHTPWYLKTEKPSEDLLRKSAIYQRLDRMLYTEDTASETSETTPGTELPQEPAAPVMQPATPVANASSELSAEELEAISSDAKIVRAIAAYPNKFERLINTYTQYPDILLRISSERHDRPTKHWYPSAISGKGDYYWFLALQRIEAPDEYALQVVAYVTTDSFQDVLEGRAVWHNLYYGGQETLSDTELQTVQTQIQNYVRGLAKRTKEALREKTAHP